ncbi:hypothetical protein [Prolixibacter bellariivorans]|uniref:hypothetical protein n=1 Tax=Prolixibacter bellariivorans TaxID=314319 RepID=UPI000A4AFD1F|nr:hypothetical protein [Prolixibacter bellariivorans]
MNNVFVYCEVEDGVVAEVSQELLTKGRSWPINSNANWKLSSSVKDWMASKIRYFPMVLMWCTLPTIYVWSLLRHHLTQRF